MPAGVSWSQYLRFVTAAALAMMAGAQVVHVYYKPMRDIHEYINRELRSLPPDIQEKVREALVKEDLLKR